MTPKVHFKTEGFLNRLDDVYRLHPKYLFIMGGMNDILRGYDINDTFDNYRLILSRLRERNITTIVQSTLYTTSPKQSEQVERLNHLLKNYCIENDIFYMDLNDKLSKERLLGEEYTFDSVHLRYNAYLVWKKEIEKVLSSH